VTGQLHTPDTVLSGGTPGWRAAEPDWTLCRSGN